MEETNEFTQRRGPAHPFLGSLLLFLAAGIVLLAVIDRSAGVAFMPRSWYANRPLWYLLALAGFIGGYFLLRQRRADQAAGQPAGRALFERVVLYTRRDCRLCDEAKQTLAKYDRWLPEIEEIDVDDDPALVERYGEYVPVVELDGQVRFRGRVNETLFQRLIDARA